MFNDIFCFSLFSDWLSTDVTSDTLFSDYVQHKFSTKEKKNYCGTKTSESWGEIVENYLADSIFYK
jgi:hypothetical protein